MTKNYLDIIEDLTKQKQQERADALVAIAEAERQKQLEAEAEGELRKQFLGPIFELLQQVQNAHEDAIDVQFRFVRPEYTSGAHVAIYPKHATLGRDILLYIEPAGCLQMYSRMNTITAGTVDDILPTLLDEISKMLTKR